MLAEASILQEEFEPRESNLALPDVLVTIEPRSQITLRVVEVEVLEPFQADHVMEPAHRFLVGLGTAEVIAGCEAVAGVEADPETTAIPSPAEDEGDILKGGPEIGA